jgi:hypothetical protein
LKFSKLALPASEKPRRGESKKMKMKNGKKLMTNQNEKKRHQTHYPSYSQKEVFVSTRMKSGFLSVQLAELK